MPCGRDLARERGVALDLLADEEERRGCAAGGERLEDRGRAARMRAVVERQVDRGAVAGRAPAHVRGRRHRGGRCGASAGPLHPIAAPIASPDHPLAVMRASCQWEPRGSPPASPAAPRPPSASSSVTSSRRVTHGRRGPRDAPLLLRLARRRSWLGGTALVACGVALQLLALSLAPLSVVQPALVLGLGLLVVLAERRLGERVERRDRLAVVGAAAGVLLVALGGEASGERRRRPSRRRARRAAGVVLVVLAAAHATRRPRLLVLAAGLGEAWAVIAAKVAVTDLADGALALLPAGARARRSPCCSRSTPR